jgi:heme/copper-type cytochrome/quinol oxidase subunit 1
MQFAIAPTMFVHLALSARALVARRAKLSHPATLGFVASATLAVLGVALGAAIRGPNTVIPAHYHASIGAVTVAFMAITPALLEAVGLPALEGRVAKIARVQPALLGFGQAVFAIGFAVAGHDGMRRKAYGSEQQVRTLAEWLGMTVMGLGGAVAVTGGVLFLVIVGATWRRRFIDLTRRGGTWRHVPARTRSNA